MVGMRAEALGYRYRRAAADALSDIDVGFPDGGLTVVMGPTGAGKSTLLMALNGAVPQLHEGRFRGRVRLGETDLAGYRVQTIAEFVGLVPQDAESRLLGRTVAEDVAFGPRNYLVPAEEIRQRVAEALSEVGLAGFEPRETARLSGGEKQRLAIAGALALHPQVLCLDESTTELDPAGRERLHGVVDELRRRGVTVVMVEHDSAGVAARADHLVVLVGGALAWQGPPSDFFRDPAPAGLVRPLPMAALGYALERAGLIVRAQIPLTVKEAERLIRGLAGDRPLPAPLPPAPPASAGDPVIELRGLCHTYPGGQPALSDVDLTIGQGDYLVLAGRNGAGKTTLARHLNGLLRPSAGQVRLNGADAASQEPWRLARKVGYVFQNPDHQIFKPTVAAEIRYGLEGMPERERERRIDEALERVGLADFREAHPFALGRGLRQRLAVAAVLALRPEILVVDEPTTGQDWAGVSTMMGLIDELNAEGTTVVLVTHDLELAARHARRVVLLDAGRIVADGTTAEVLGRPSVLARAGLPPSQVVEFSQRLWPGSPSLLEADELGRHLVRILAGSRR